MPLLSHLLPVLSAMATGFLVASIWQGLVLAGCLALLLRLLPGLTAAARSAIWTAVLLLVLVVPGLSTQMHGGGAAAVGHPGLWHVSQSWTVALLGVWAGLTVLRLAQLLGSAIRLHRLARGAVPVTPAEPIAALLRGSPRQVELCLSPEAQRPSVAGFLRPRILLSPGLFASLSGSELQHLVLHELEHLRRYDDWTNLMQKLALALIPLHPVLLWLDQQMCLQRELACDDSVLRQTRARKAYAACLARLAEDSMVRRGFSLALGALGSREHSSELARRVHRILRGPDAVSSRPKTRLVTAGLLAGICVATAGLARSPELVSFTPAGAPAMPAAGSLAGIPPLTGSRALPALQPASYAAFGAHPMLLKAVMPERRSSSPVPAQSSIAARHTRRFSLSRQRANTLRRAGLSLTAWQPRSTPVALQSATWMVPEKAASSELPTPGAAMTLAVSEDSQSVYAAVPVAGGWLLLQL